MITNKKFFQFGPITLVVFCLAHAAFSFGEQPMAEIKKTVERIDAARSNSSTTKAETDQAIRAIILPRFDFTDMARQSLGSYWKKLDAREGDFVLAFTNFVAISYMGTVESYRGEKIIYLREGIDQNLAHVDTRIVMSKGDPISVSYRLRLMADDWKIYDVVIDDISLVSNFRSQFSRILAHGSFDELLRKMGEKG